MPKRPEGLGPVNEQGFQGYSRKRDGEKTQRNTEVYHSKFTIIREVVNEVYPDPPNSPNKNENFRVVLAVTLLWASNPAIDQDIISNVSGLEKKSINKMIFDIIGNDEVTARWEELNFKVTDKESNQKSQGRGKVPSYEEVVVRVVDGQSYAQIAREFNVHPNAIYTRVRSIYYETREDLKEYREWLKTGVRPDIQNEDAA